ncbi:hypothetical protein ACPOL_1123 [Acidisarcina polymorpha]|uniref:Uncharacterized protein n=1 Tax=Acidisarcina polymorpha TaxID=2211140 RepID=A0A2Z5FUE3_9BACT|nr:hypothetical protein ACPOL_1123 [Acidisarcina polymorpha]
MIVCHYCRLRTRERTNFGLRRGDDRLRWRWRDRGHRWSVQAYDLGLRQIRLGFRQLNLAWGLDHWRWRRSDFDTRNRRQWSRRRGWCRKDQCGAFITGHWGRLVQLVDRNPEKNRAEHQICDDAHGEGTESPAWFGQQSKILTYRRARLNLCRHINCSQPFNQFLRARLQGPP